MTYKLDGLVGLQILKTSNDIQICLAFFLKIFSVKKKGKPYLIRKFDNYYPIFSGLL